MNGRQAKHRELPNIHILLDPDIYQEPCVLFLVDWVQRHAHEYLIQQQTSEPARGISNDTSSTCSGITYINYNQRFRDNEFDFFAISH